MTRYTVMHRNGVGDTKSAWYIDKQGISAEEAGKLSNDLLSKQYQGWHTEVRVMPDEEVFRDQP